MSITVTCSKCGQQFEPLPNEQKTIEQIQSNGGKIAMVSCTLCKKTFVLNLCNLTEKEKNTEIPFLCPVSHCGGWVSYVDDLDGSKSFYGCGECGQVWADRIELENDITASIEIWPYRKSAYMPINSGGWSPVEYKNIPSELFCFIESEPFPDSKAKKK